MALFPLVPERIIKSSPEFKTTIVDFENGAEQRLSNWSVPKTTFKLKWKLMTKTDMETLLNFFKARKGAFEKFEFMNHVDEIQYDVRFKDDALKIEHLNVEFSQVTVEVITC